MEVCLPPILDHGLDINIGLDRNTTLPHPDADLSPGACISQDDINPDRVFSRSRRSFLRKKHRHTLQHGKITPQSEAIYSVLSLVSSTDEVNYEGQKPSSTTGSPTVSSVRFSKDETDSIRSRKDDETPPTSPDVPSRRPKKGLLSRWRKDEDDRRS